MKSHERAANLIQGGPQAARGITHPITFFLNCIYYYKVELKYGIQGVKLFLDKNMEYSIPQILPSRLLANFPTRRKVFSVIASTSMLQICSASFFHFQNEKFPETAKILWAPGPPRPLNPTVPGLCLREQLKERVHINMSININ